MTAGTPPLFAQLTSHVCTQSTGYGAAFSGFATCLTIIATLVAHRLPTLMTLFACVSYVYLAIWASLHLPYFHSALNTVSVATYSTLAFLCVGATISTALDNDYTFSNVWLALFIVPVALGVLGPRLQMRRIHKCVAVGGEVHLRARDLCLLAQAVGSHPASDA